MKIVSVEKYYFTTGGASRVFFETNRLLEERGHQVIPFTGRYPQNLPSAYADYFVPRFTMFSGEETGRATPAQMLKAFADAVYAVDAARAVDRIVADHKPDLAHLHTILYQLSPSVIERFKRARIPVVQTLHDFSLGCASRYLYVDGAICERCRRHRYHHILLRNCCNKSLPVSLMSFTAKAVHALFHLYPGKVDLFIAPSAFVKTKMIEWGLPERKIVHIDHFLPAPPGPEPDGGHDDYILYAGYLVRQKGVYTLLKAMAKVRGVRLLIAGRGPERDGMAAFIRSHNLGNIEFAGFLSGPDLTRAIHRCRFLVFPSECYETFGMGVLEAFLAGKPVVASDLGALPELVAPGERGDLFEPGNPDDLAAKVEALFRDEDRTRVMGRAARAFAVNNYNQDSYYEKLMSVYRRLTGSSSDR